MLMTAVVLPDAFAATHFADPSYHLNTEMFLRGIDSNGLILVDAEERLYHELCDTVNPLAGLHQAQEMKNSMQCADFAVRGDHCH